MAEVIVIVGTAGPSGTTTGISGLSIGGRTDLAVGSRGSIGDPPVAAIPQDYPEEYKELSNGL